MQILNSHYICTSICIYLTMYYRLVLTITALICFPTVLFNELPPPSFTIVIMWLISPPAVLWCDSRTSEGRRHRAWANNQKGGVFPVVSCFVQVDEAFRIWIRVFLQWPVDTVMTWNLCRQPFSSARHVCVHC